MTLYIVGTPIGNLSDMTNRAAEVLNSADFILCEDTRVTSVLLNRFNIKKPLYSYHKFNEQNKASSIIDKMLKENLNAALVTDAGTPCISDPGSVIVAAAYQAGIEVVGIPGASAAVLALSVSGYAIDSYTFLGFLSRKNSERKKIIDNIKNFQTQIYVIYESPQRIIETLMEIETAFPAAEAAVCNDLTKKFERVYRGGAGSIIRELQNNEKANKGEYVIVLKTNHKIHIERNEDSVDETAFNLSKKYSKNELYDLILELKKIFNKSLKNN